MTEKRMRRERPVKAGKAFSVAGRVFREGGEPLAGLLVRLMRRDIDGETLLERGKTGDDGSFEVAYGRGADAFDVVVRVEDGRGREVAASSILFKAGDRETVDFKVQDDVA